MTESRGLCTNAALPQISIFVSELGQVLVAFSVSQHIQLSLVKCCELLRTGGYSEKSEVSSWSWFL